MASKIIPLIPKHTVYVEPFCGGAAVMFKKPWPDVTNNDHYREVINDVDERLVNFYRVLRDPKFGPELCRRLELTPYSRSEWNRSKESILSPDPSERAWGYFVNIRQSFSNILNKGWRVGRFGQNEAATWVGKKILAPYLDRMESVYIECGGAMGTIRRWDSPQTFFYCDPPYPGTEQSHYSGYTLQDFQSLVDTLDQCEGSFILSNYDQPDAKIPDDWERFELSASAGIAVGKNGSGGSKRTEVVWRRQHKGELRPEIQKLFDSGKFDCFTGGG
jgi:DNA adenine methylase